MHSDGPSRSTFVTVVAWVFIVLSAFTSLVSVLQNVMVWVLMSPPTWINLFVAGYFVASIATLVVSIGLLKRQSWARAMFIALLALGIAWFVVTVPLQWILIPSMPDMADSFRVMQMVMRVFTTVFAVGMAGLFGWMIKRLLSPAVKREFDQGSMMTSPSID